MALAATAGIAPAQRPLSDASVESLVAALVDKGAAEARLSAYGFGSHRPLEGDGAAAANRRVEVRRATQ